MTIKLRIFGHSTISSKKIDTSSSNITDFFVLFQVLNIFLFQISLLKDSFNLVDFCINILFFHPLFFEPIDDRSVRKIYNNSITDYFT